MELVRKERTIMKTTRTLLLLSIVAMLFSSCQKDSVTFRLRF